MIHCTCLCVFTLCMYLCYVQRKKLLQDDGEKRGGGKGGEDMVKALRKKNSELIVATKELEDKIKALKAENDQLVRIIWIIPKNLFYLLHACTIHMYSKKIKVLQGRANRMCVRYWPGSMPRTSLSTLSRSMARTGSSQISGTKWPR